MVASEIRTNRKKNCWDKRSEEWAKAIIVNGGGNPSGSVFVKRKGWGNSVTPQGVSVARKDDGKGGSDGGDRAEKPRVAVAGPWKIHEFFSQGEHEKEKEGGGTLSRETKQKLNTPGKDAGRSSAWPRFCLGTRVVNKGEKGRGPCQFGPRPPQDESLLKGGRH